MDMVLAFLLYLAVNALPSASNDLCSGIQGRRLILQGLGQDLFGWAPLTRPK